MNKLIALGFALLLAQTTAVSATESYYYRYGSTQPAPVATTEPIYTEQAATPTNTIIQQDNVIYTDEAAPQPTASVTTTQRTRATPNVAHYGFYGQKSVQSVDGQYIIGGNPYTTTSGNQNSYYASPVFDQKKQKKQINKLYYLGVRAGLGSTFGWDHGNHHPIKPIFGAFAGTWVTPDVRAEAELDYHMKGKISDTEKSQVTYKQYDLGTSVYYDFEPTRYGFKPFVGGGLWFVKKKLKEQAVRAATKTTSGWRVGLSASAGVSYPITDVFSLSAMLRGRYIITNDSIYNLEALLGAHYAF